MMKRILAAAAIASSAFMTTGAQATIFQNDIHADGVWQAYDDVNETYSLRYKAGNNDGFWLVVSDGENPKRNVDEYAILYGDLNANRITAYVYDGNNNNNSYETKSLLGTYDNVFTNVNGKVQFDLDVAAINGAFNNAGWDGVSIGDKAGIWFHKSTDSAFSYDANGGLLDYSFGTQSWVDTANLNTFTRNSPNCANGANAAGFANPCGATGFNSNGGGSVPVPGGLAFILLGAAAFFGARRKV